MPVAQGNHWHGYRGAIIRDYDGPDEHWVIRCPHRHATPREARTCVANGWFRYAFVEGDDPVRWELSERDG